MNSKINSLEIDEKQYYSSQKSIPNSNLKNYTITATFQHFLNGITKINCSELDSVNNQFLKNVFLIKLEYFPQLRWGKQFTIIRTALNFFRNSVNTIEIDFEQTKKLAFIQLKNIITLMNLFQRILNEENSSALIKLQNVEITYKKYDFKKWVPFEILGTRIVANSFIFGWEPITFPDLNTIEFLIYRKIREIKKEENDQFQKHKLMKKIVSSNSIHYQAKLHKAIRSGKHWASTQHTLTPLGTSNNHVYKLSKVAYLKVGKNNEKAVGKFEHLIWDVAVIMRMEKLFVPTGETQMHFKEHLLDTIENEVISGSIQPAQSGWILDSYLYKSGLKRRRVDHIKYPIERSSLIKATIASIFFGMRDAHGKNIIITKKGRIKFFDNTGCLPNSNGWTKRNNQIYPTYRSSLLELEGSYSRLSNLERMDIIKNVAQLQKKMFRIKEYLFSVNGKAILKSLPSDWLITDLALSAMRERLNLLEAALKNPKIINLRDLIVASNPGYKFSFALSVATIFQKFDVSEIASELQKLNDVELLLSCEIMQRSYRFHRNIGFESDSIKIKYLIEAGYDISFFKKLADQSPATCEQMIVEISAKMSDHNYLMQLSCEKFILHERIRKNIDLGSKIINEIWEKAAIDFKNL